ncbi:NADH-quinone oxidoreductase subunit C [Streptomyces sp. NBC_00249]|uniref:NADH-quinone oxidoreductase subunit C n=1 Tax=Streptomyces sp. NBC_00249 TaxID=2975690 RepID=UPI00225C1275|nr:NADH-quinone oxidoreductase subunit C [Streptomyces sp. NBC_00249]MCX5195058.1 NADH-quinone oxidoreductase subunit C [Streptomyces sp. NBC_00249]
MNLYDSLPDGAATVFGAEAVGSFAYDVLTVDVPVGSWISSLEIARDKLGCTFFDWLSAVDEPGTGFRICAHVVSLENHRVRRLLLRTTVPHTSPSLPSAVAVYAGAEWHERETFEMFGVVFTDHPNLVHLLLPENFEGHPLRKDFVLAARVAKAWPGAKEPGEAHDPDAPKRRQMLPPGVPDPNEWGPLKGQLPPAPARPARTPRAAGAAADRPARRPRPDTPTEGADTPARPVRRTRSVSDGSASQATPPGPSPEAPADATDTPRPARRTRSVADGSASQATPPGATPAAADGSASETTPPGPSPEAPADATDTPRPARRTRSVADGSASQTPGPEPEAPTRAAPRSPDAPWHDPKPAFEEPPATPPAPPSPDPAPKPDPDPDPDTTTGGDA